MIEKEQGEDIYSGDTILLRAHTGAYISVKDGRVSARHRMEREYQELTIEHFGDFPYTYQTQEN